MLPKDFLTADLSVYARRDFSEKEVDIQSIIGLEAKTFNRQPYTRVHGPHGPGRTSWHR